MDIESLESIVQLPPPHARVAARRARNKGDRSRSQLPTRDADEEVPARHSGTPGASAASAAAVPPVVPPAARAPILRGDVPRTNSSDDESLARIVLAIDYGTTFTGVAYAQHSGRPVDLGDIHVVQNWPGASELKVPSQISYSNSKQGLRQYGYSIDEDSDVLSKTKLELQDSHDRGHELTTFAQTLHGLASLRLNDASAIEGRIPRHLSKTAEDIVLDYLERIADVTYDDMINTLGRAVPEQIPIDIVITHPAKWSEEALNKTYRAATSAFGDLFPTMRNVSFVSEPEACAHYTLRAAQKVDHARFRKGDCFIVVDAGGGTVDLASFQIVNIDSTNNKFQMKPAGHISGFACGSTYVDEGFVKILKKRLGPEDSEKIVGTSAFGDGGHFVWSKFGLKVYKDFLPIKHGFNGSDTRLSEYVPLPRALGIQDRVDHGIHDSHLELTADDIREIFSFSVNKTLALIDAQISSLNNATPRCKVKSIFLSGGFARSEYLFSRVTSFAIQQGISVERGHDCWSAVSKGAVMKGLGLLTEKPPVITRSPCYYGIKIRQHYSDWRNTDDSFEVDSQGVKWATEQVKWFVRKNDAIQPGKLLLNKYTCHWQLYAKDFKTSKPLFSTRKPQDKAGTLEERNAVYRDIAFVASRKDEAPTRFTELKPDDTRIIVLHCNMSKVPPWNRIEYGEKADKYMKFSVQVEICVTTVEVIVTVTSGGVVVGGPEGMSLGLWS